MLSQRAAVAAPLRRTPPETGRGSSRGDLLRQLSVLGASCNYTAAAAFVTKNCLPKFIELKMHFGHKWRLELN